MKIALGIFVYFPFGGLQRDMMKIAEELVSRGAEVTVFTGAYFVWCCIRERALPWKGALIAALAFALVGAPGVLASLASPPNRWSR